MHIHALSNKGVNRVVNVYINGGKYAEFLLVDKDILTCPLTEIHTAKPEAIYFEGKKLESILGSMIERENHITLSSCTTEKFSPITFGRHGTHWFMTL